MGDEHGFGKDEAYTVNLKRLVARELDMGEERQHQATRAIEQSLVLQARINEIAMQSLQAFTSSMDERQKDARIAGVRKEHKAEERAEELEETMTRQVSTINESIAGIIAILEAAGVVGASQQTSGETSKY